MKKRMIGMLMILSLMFGMLTGCASNSSVNVESNYDSNYNLVEEEYFEEIPEETASETSGMVYEEELDGAIMDMEYPTEEMNRVDFNTEEYNAIVENSYMSVKNNPLSTFSADVDTASYSNVRRMINDEEYVTADAVRLEEMINYFDYEFKRPKNGEPFSVTPELTDCPWNEESKLLTIGIRAEEIGFEEKPDSNLVFLIDVSGSMGDYDKLPLLIEAFSMLTENLTSRDCVSIVTYAGADEVILVGESGSNKEEIIEALEKLESGGSTNGADGINTAYEIAEKNFIKGGNNRILLATDGDLNVGITSEGELTNLVEEKRKSGIFLTVLGFGTGNIKDNKMEALADNGNGNYGYIDSVLEAKKILVEEMSSTLYAVAKDVKFQVEFNPAVVKGYRLIGYENRLLNEEDFNDDTKDAGEIGSGHQLMAMYEVVLKDSEIEIPNSDLKYQEEMETSESSEWLTISVRYKEPDEDESKLFSVPVGEEVFRENPSENVLFASAVAEFGMLLRDSEYKGNASYDSVIELLSDLDSVEDDVYKDEFYSLVKKYARMIE